MTKGVVNIYSLIDFNHFMILVKQDFLRQERLGAYTFLQFNNLITKLKGNFLAKKLRVFNLQQYNHFMT